MLFHLSYTPYPYFLFSPKGVSLGLVLARAYGAFGGPNPTGPALAQRAR